MDPDKKPDEVLDDYQRANIELAMQGRKPKERRSSGKKRLNVEMNRVFYEEVQAKAQDEGNTISDVVRELLWIYLTVE